MTYEQIVEKAQAIAAKGSAEKIKDHLAIQYNITGEGAGAFYMEIKDGKISVCPYEYYDRDILVTGSGENLLAMLEGKLDMVGAYLSGKIKAQGDFSKLDILKSLIARK